MPKTSKEASLLFFSLPWVPFLATHWRRPLPEAETNRIDFRTRTAYRYLLSQLCDTVPQLQHTPRSPLYSLFLASAQIVPIHTLAVSFSSSVSCFLCGLYVYYLVISLRIWHLFTGVRHDLRPPLFNIPAYYCTDWYRGLNYVCQCLSLLAHIPTYSYVSACLLHCAPRNLRSTIGNLDF